MQAAPTGLTGQIDFQALPSPVFIIGAAHTGKSELAQRVLSANTKTLVVGTASVEEDAFKERIQKLKSMRPPLWETREDDQHLPELLRQECPGFRQIMVDSLNQWVAALLLDGSSRYSLPQLEARIEDEGRQLCESVQAHADCRFVIVSNEIASGISPPRALPRLFRQMTSRINCRIAEICNSVILVSAGIPMVIKGRA